MRRNKILAIISAVSISACLYACGSDDDTNPSGGAGTGGATTGGKGGSGGKTGTAGSGGKVSSGGSGNEAGQDENVGGGAGGPDQSGGAGGDTGSMGGESGIAGAGGEGGAPVVEQTLAEACAAACAPAHAVADCTNTQDACVAQCTAYPATVDMQSPDFIDPANVDPLKKEYLAAIRCIAKKVTTTDQFACPADGTTSGMTQSPKQHSDCDTELCKWTCDDGNLPGTGSADLNVYTWCGC